MQFVPNGPDVPEELLRAHAEGRVVFFCGAGISCNSGLPTFRGLINKIYEDCALEPSPIEQSCYEKGEYDRELDLLERRIVGGKNVVRKSVEKILTIPDKTKTQTHKALLTLGRDNYGQGQLRLVTTNYDRLFHIASEGLSDFKEYSAPCLPIPKKSRWDGLVFLHGLLPNEQASEIDLNRLVLTSGDFGLAYLTERWASRFVSELFRNFVVCFVGYSINDPVIRYMMDALSADRSLGEDVEKVWVFATISKQEGDKQDSWEAKGVTPILCDDRDLLHSTLKEWARVYSDGFEGKKNIIQTFAWMKPQASTVEDNFVRKVLWAITDSQGNLAHYFADLEDNPPIEWFFDVFAKDFLSAKQLINYDLLPNQDVSSISGNFSLVRRLPGTQRAIPMSLGEMRGNRENLDDLMYQLMRWLSRHLNNPRLFVWLVENVGMINPTFRFILEEAIQDYHKSKNCNGEIVSIVDHVDPIMERLWNLYLNGYVRSLHNSEDLFWELWRWKEEFLRLGLTLTLKHRLVTALRPMIIIRQRFSIAEDVSDDRQKTVSDYVSWDLALKSHDVFSFFQELNSREEWLQCLPELCEDFESLLKEALELTAEMNDGAERSDLAIFDMPSIEEHSQNQKVTDWVILIELLRDSWLQINKIDPMRAKKVVRSWMSSSYLTFKRLGIFAAGKCDGITGWEWLDWLIGEDNLLWNPSFKREIYLLLTRKAQLLTAEECRRLEDAILHNYPARYVQDYDKQYLNLLVMQKLTFLKASGVDLGEKASIFWEKYLEMNPNFDTTPSEMETFSVWCSSDDFVPVNSSQTIPNQTEELCCWLEENKAIDMSSNIRIQWELLCQSDAGTCFNALRSLSTKNIWPLECWKCALNVWNNKELINEFEDDLFSIFSQMSDEIYLKLLGEIAGLFEAITKKYDEKIEKFRKNILDNCERIIRLGQNDDSHHLSISCSMTRAINHPCGKVASALVNLLFSKDAKDGSGIPEDLLPLFDQLVCVKNNNFQSARVIFAFQLIGLFRVDNEWATQKLLPLFNWGQFPHEAADVWQGFLWSPRLYLPLILKMKPQILQTISHVEELEDRKRYFMRYLTSILVDAPPGVFGAEDHIQVKLGKVESSTLSNIIWTLERMLDGVEEEKVNSYWEKRIKPFIEQYWPKDKSLRSSDLSSKMVSFMIVSKTLFPVIFKYLRSWLTPIQHPSTTIASIKDKKLHVDFPRECLDLLSDIVDENSQVWYLQDLLDELICVNPALKKNAEYNRLRLFL